MMAKETDFLLILNEKKLVLKLTSLSDEKEIAINDIGWTSRVYIVGNGKYVIKFPRTDEVKKEYEHEIIILKLLEQIKTNIYVPKIKWTDVNNNYLGYEGVIGRDFIQVVAKLDDEQMQRIGRAIGEFLKQLHALNLTGTRTTTIHDEIKEFQHKYVQALPVIKSDFNKEEQIKLERLIYNEMPAEIKSLGQDLALCHGDLGYWNMILGENGDIGVIDFGDIGYYDKSKDFIGLSDDVILNEALRVYGDSTVLRKKITIRQKVLPILDLPYFITKKDEENISKSLTKIRDIL